MDFISRNGFFVEEKGSCSAKGSSSSCSLVSAVSTSSAQMPELCCSVAAGMTGKVGGGGATPLNIAEQAKRLKQTLLRLGFFFFWQAPTLLCRFSYLPSNLQVTPEAIPREGRVKRREPGDLSCSGNLPQTSQLTYLHLNLQLFWEIEHPDWSKLPSTDTRHASKMQLGNEFPLLWPLQHPSFEDLTSIPSNGSALVPRQQVKKRILEAVHVLPWGEEAV